MDKETNSETNTNTPEETTTSTATKVPVRISVADAGAEEAEAATEPEATAETEPEAPVEPETAVEPEVEEPVASEPEGATEPEATPEPETPSEPETEAEPEAPAEPAEAAPEVPAETPSEPVAPEAPAAPVVGNSDEPPASTPTVQASPLVPPKKHKPVFAWLLLVLILAVGGYAAWKYLYNKPVTTSSNSPASSASNKKDVALVRVGLGFPIPTSFYPSNPGNTGSTMDINHQIFEGLTTYQDGTKVVPLLATGWTNPDPSTWNFSLHHNVMFHDGKIMTAKDVKASFDAVLKDDDLQEYVSTIKSVDVVDDYTVKITTDGPDALLPNKLTFVNVFDTTSGKSNDPLNGTGPYVVKNGMTPSSTSLDLVANPSYWNGHVYTKELDYTKFADYDAVLAGLKNGNIDLGTLRHAQAAQLDQSKFTVTSGGYYTVGQLIPNSMRGGPLANAKVRAAIWQALDPNALLKAYGQTGTAASQIVPEAIPGHDPSLTRPTTNAAAAKQALAAAGYPNGFSFTLTFFSPAVDKMAAEIQSELKQAGVTVNLDPQTDGDALVAKATGGKTDMFYNSETTDLIDGSDIMSNYVKQPYYDNAQLDSLYAQVNQTLGAAKRLTLLKQMSDLVYTDKATLPLFNIDGTIVGSSKKLNLQLNTQEIGGDPGINFSKVYTN